MVPTFEFRGETGGFRDPKLENSIGRALADETNRLRALRECLDVLAQDSVLRPEARLIAHLLERHQVLGGDP